MYFLFFFTGADVSQLQPFKVVYETFCSTRNRKCFRNWSKLLERRKDENNDVTQAQKYTFIYDPNYNYNLYSWKELSDNCISVKYVQIPKKRRVLPKTILPILVMGYPLMTSHNTMVVSWLLRQLTTWYVHGKVTSFIGCPFIAWMCCFYQNIKISEKNIL